MDDARRRELAEIRERAVLEHFGGPSIYRLLEQRNPELRLILNAGILAGLDHAEWTRLAAEFDEGAVLGA